jgi:hypothetical protein
MQLLIEKSLKYINKNSSCNFEDDIYFVSIEIDKNKKENLRIYKDYIETEILKEEIIVIDTSIKLKNDNIDFKFLEDCNKESFFSKVYTDDINNNNFIVIESCIFYENTTPKLLSIVIDEITNISYNIRDYLLK